MMEFLEILKQTFKIFFTNGKLIPFITLLFVLANSIILASYLFSTKLILHNFSTQLVNLSPKIPIIPESPNIPNINKNNTKYYQDMVSLMKQEFRFFAAANSALFFAISLAYSLFATATISASAESFRGDSQSSMKEIVSAALISWKRMLVTLAHTTLLGLGYSLLVLAFFILPLQPIFLDPTTTGKNIFSPFVIITLVVATVLYLYLAVVWTLAIVTSVLEEKSGFEALWKASVVINGLRLKGFLLKIIFGGLSLAVLRVSTMTLSIKPTPQDVMGMKMLPSILLISITTLVGVFSLISFTVLYFEGQKINKDNLIEMQGNPVEYTKVASSNIP